MDKRCLLVEAKGEVFVRIDVSLIRIVEEKGFETVVAGSIREALRFLEEQRWDLVIVVYYQGVGWFIKKLGAEGKVHVVVVAHELSLLNGIGRSGAVIIKYKGDENGKNLSGKSQEELRRELDRLNGKR
ncbi:hypothetical protein A2716_01355 [candidate division WWE3 bacterium RIFCSPHIGHO2_01_FULL_40_23]|uniref:Response regulatory domain-containing protein n=1 Tax=candidate division WWE3 bacterium RIFCSPLOWO2_01_FULL_41_18 TaxID=1802625 RepID=A0A1F4VEH9_UNCKA|nr:MAG: hypothetical protein A2716_01355 [candidate division WWE3 bacterium RIFCSPHIGHO2_01_FULL_40_23]OGC55378.1 MAG: hypothetical protein A3A78_00260 [candidate division WWE3 bacterium RIFCSPLOWO2_01_FULL_41_18]